MPKKIKTKSGFMVDVYDQRAQAIQYYRSKYFNLFMNAYKWSGIEPRQQDFLMRKLYSVGTIGAFIVEGTKPNESAETASINNYPNGMIAFTTWAGVLYDINDWPIKVQLTPSRGAMFIPRVPQLVNKDVVIGWAQRNHKPVQVMVDYYINKIVDVEMTIRTQLLSHKVPWLVACTPENEAKLKRLFDRVENDEPVLYVSADEIDALKSLIGGNTYIIDKLYQYKMQLENELLTYLGIDNVGGVEKKEHLMVDEVNANNQIINDSADCFLSVMKEFCEQVREYLGFPLDVESTSTPVVAETGSDEEEEDEENE